MVTVRVGVGPCKLCDGTEKQKRWLNFHGLFCNQFATVPSRMRSTRGKKTVVGPCSFSCAIVDVTVLVVVMFVLFLFFFLLRLLVVRGDAGGGDEDEEADDEEEEKT